MRCPKCGYISFDHMETCLKCKKDISGRSDVEGTTYHAANPSFLKIPAEEESVEENAAALDANEDFAEDNYDFSDPDLEALADVEEDITIEDSGDDEGGIFFADPDSADFELEPDVEDDEEIGFEFELEGGDDDLALLNDEETTAPALNVPDELADISDLAPPGEEASMPTADLELGGMNLSLDDDMNLDEDLDLDGLDLDLGFENTTKNTDAELSLSLDDIDLSSGDITMDTSDLDGISLDLDLDGLDSAPAQKKEQSLGSLDGITLSLD